MCVTAFSIEFSTLHLYLIMFRLRHLLIGIAASLLFITNLNTAQAQVAVGIRGGNPSGITAKFYTGKSNAIDVIVGLNYGGRERNGDRNLYGYSLSADYQWIKRTNTTGLDWYYGLGASVGRSNYYYWKDEYRDDFYQFAILGALGLEYVIPSSPIQIFGELNPGVDLIPGGIYFGGGIGIRIKL